MSLISEKTNNICDMNLKKIKIKNIFYIKYIYINFIHSSFQAFFINNTK